MCRACAAGLAVRQPQQCYRAGTSLLYYKASSVSSFPPENGRVKHKSLANTYWANYPYSPSRLVVPSSRRQPLYAAPVPRRLLAAGERLPLPGVLRGPAVWGRPFCGRCGAPTAFEVFGCDECRDKGFAFDGRQAPLRYEGMGEEPVHALKRGYLPRRGEGDGAVDVGHARGRPVRRGGAGVAALHVARQARI
jgi:hypothetical protein